MSTNYIFFSFLPLFAACSLGAGLALFVSLTTPDGQALQFRGRPVTPLTFVAATFFVFLIVGTMGLGTEIRFGYMSNFTLILFSFVLAVQLALCVLMLCYAGTGKRHKLFTIGNLIALGLCILVSVAGCGFIDLYNPTYLLFSVALPFLGAWLKRYEPAPVPVTEADKKREKGLPVAVIGGAVLIVCLALILQ